MRCRSSDPQEGGRALQDKRGVGDVAVYCFAGRHKSYAWSSYTRAMRLASRNTHWGACVDTRCAWTPAAPLGSAP
eukprot:11498580-Alexandrium_andersonii.AAC.1